MHCSSKAENGMASNFSQNKVLENISSMHAPPMSLHAPKKKNMKQILLKGQSAVADQYTYRKQDMFKGSHERQKDALPNEQRQYIEMYYLKIEA